MNDLEKQLNGLYDKTNADPNQIADIYFYIIQIKKLNPHYISYKQSLYIDIKSFIESYIISRTKRDFGYDVIDKDKIVNAIYSLNSVNERFALLSWAYKELKINQFEEEGDDIISFIRKEKLFVLWNKKDKLKYIKILSHLASYNLLVVVCLLFITFAISYILFLPTNNFDWSVIRFHYVSFHENFYLNHFFNLIDYLLDISDNINIEPIKWQGVLLLSFMKIFYILFIVNYLFQIILERLQINK